ncbi:MAG TPA: CdaR family protein [Candidatus Limnocylindria bacterium]|nr:CdaR family protein [Candidatus Limnocylindria bacterium]
MTEKAPAPAPQGGAVLELRSVARRVWGALKTNWRLKLVSIAIALIIWGGLMSQDASLTREKVFADVPLTITGLDTLQRSGLVVVDGLGDIKPLRVRAEVPQKAYDAASYIHYSIRADMGRITAAGRQTVPIQTSASSAYGAVTWLSQEEVTVMVEEYVTRRRVPVRLERVGKIAEGYYAAGASVDPASVVVSGPRSLVQDIVVVTATLDLGAFPGKQGTAAVPFRLLRADGTEVKSPLISVTSENVLLDTLLVEQSVYPTTEARVNLTGAVVGEPAPGFEVKGVTADPETVVLAGEAEDIDGITLVDLSSPVDVTGQRETIIRAVRVQRPTDVVYLSGNSVYVTVEIGPVEGPVLD